MDPYAVIELQRTAGNRAVAALFAGEVVAQRDPLAPELPTRELPPATQRWKYTEPFRGAAALVRTTTVEATAWGEIAPGPPRVTYRREVELETADGITFYLDIRGTVALAPGTELPKSADAAIARSGRMVRSQRTTRVEGGGVVEVNEYSLHDLANTSFGFVAGAVMPDYAQLGLTPSQQESAILRYLAGLARKPRTAPASAEPSEAVKVGIAAANLATDFAPLVGELKDLYRAVTGEDPVTGEKLSRWERVLAALGAIPLIGKLGKGIGVGLKFLGRGLSWLKGRGAGLAHWFSERIARWRNSRKGRQLEKESEQAKQLADGGKIARAAKITIREGDVMIAVVAKDGTLLAHHTPNLSHRELINRELGGVLPAGAEAVTIGKEGGRLMTVRSMNIHGNSLPASAEIWAGVLRAFD